MNVQADQGSSIYGCESPIFLSWVHSVYDSWGRRRPPASALMRLPSLRRKTLLATYAHFQSKPDYGSSIQVRITNSSMRHFNANLLLPPVFRSSEAQRRKPFAIFGEMGFSSR